MHLPGEAPHTTDRDVDHPSSYRIYDYLLGGSFNFAVDRAFAKELLARVPWAREVARANRSFLIRVVRFAISLGVKQFLDIGSGIVTSSRVDQVAHALDDSVRMVYVDSDPIAVAHAEVLADGDPRAAALRADPRDVPGVLGAPEVTGLLDLAQPVGLLMAKVLHMLPDEDDPAGVVADYQSAVVPGSVLAIAHATMEDVPDQVLAAAPMYRNSSEGMHDRPRSVVRSFFGDWDLVEPGVVFTSEWRPDDVARTPADPGWSVFLAGVAVKRPAS